MSLFVADSNFFIEAHRVSYPLDVATGFWSKVKALADRGALMSIDKVRDELYGRRDDLENWMRANLPSTFFQDTSPANVMSQYAQVAKWANSRSSHYTAQALNEFLSSNEADAYLVAFILSSPADQILVTHEKSDPARKNKIKIPEACVALGAGYCKPMDMFRQLGETF